MTIYAHREHHIDCGHRVYGHESKCALFHGHGYNFTFYCEAPELDQVGRVIDFGVIKSTLCTWLENNWDHRFLLFKEDNWASKLDELGLPGLVVVPFNPTAENIGKYILEELAPKLLDGSGVQLTRVVVMETPKCGATVEK